GRTASRAAASTSRGRESSLASRHRWRWRKDWSAPSPGMRPSAGPGARRPDLQRACGGLNTRSSMLSSSPLPRISVVVPSYNQGRFLRHCLDSIFSQGYPNLEVVVMDGGSTDDSVAILQEMAPLLAYWQSQPDGGQSAAINAGMRHCT